MVSVSKRGITLALMAGCAAAFASVSAKFATNYDEAKKLCHIVLLIVSGGPSVTDFAQYYYFVENVIWVVRGIGFCCIFLFNALMWTLFSKSLQLCSSSVEATVTNAASNFLVTAVVSFILFGERLPLLWWLGSCLILIGLLLIHRGGQRSSKDTGKRKSS